MIRPGHSKHAAGQAAVGKTQGGSTDASPGNLRRPSRPFVLTFQFSLFTYFHYLCSADRTAEARSWAKREGRLTYITEKRLLNALFCSSIIISFNYK